MNRAAWSQEQSNSNMLQASISLQWGTGAGSAESLGSGVEMLAQSIRTLFEEKEEAPFQITSTERVHFSTFVQHTLGSTSSEGTGSSRHQGPEKTQLRRMSLDNE